MTGLTQDQHRKLDSVRQLIDGTNLFAFEKAGKYFLYREGQNGDRNSLVLVRSNVDDFVSAVKHAAGAK